MLRLKRGIGVEDRSEYCDLAKGAFRHLAAREATLVNVAHVAGSEPGLRDVSEQPESSMRERHPYDERVERMSDGVRDSNLRNLQEFESDLLELTQVVGTEIERELSEALPEIKGELDGTEREADFEGAGRLQATGGRRDP